MGAESAADRDVTVPVPPPLYAVLDVDACARAGCAPHDAAAAFQRAGVSLIQVRGKSIGAAALLDLTRAVIREGPARVIVNDRPDVARIAGAGGVHVGQDDLLPSDVRAIVGPEPWVGLSTHTLEQARLALDEPIDYLAIGPVFETGTKATGYQAVGLDLVRRVALLAEPRGVPVVAIGGITLERTPSVLAAGAAAVCVISDLLRGDIEVRARQFVTVSAANLRPLSSTHLGYNPAGG
jgi:thiamine-phosphate pyrophosphorylase